MRQKKNSGTRYSNSNLFCNYCMMNSHDISHCFKLQRDLKKLDHSVKKDEKKDKEEQDRYQVLLDIKSYMDANGPTNSKRIPCLPKVIQIFLAHLFYLIQMITLLWNNLIPRRNHLILPLILSTSLSTLNFQ